MAIKYQNEVPQYICISVILIDSVFRIGENYCPQVFLEECKYVAKKKEKKDAWILFWQEDSDTGNSDEEDSNEENSNEENVDTAV